jgi:hypothetical protein
MAVVRLWLRRHTVETFGRRSADAHKRSYRSSESGAGRATDTRPGVNLGGGLEYFYSRRGTITFETLYHAVSEVDTPLTTFNKGQFWTYSVGLKRYF